MRFLQRLAAIAMPDAAQAGSAARAALPSRFEPMRASALDPWNASVTDFATFAASPDPVAAALGLATRAEAATVFREHRSADAAPHSSIPPEDDAIRGRGHVAQAPPRSPLRPTARSTESAPFAPGELHLFAEHPQDVDTPPLPLQPLKHFASTEPTERDPILPKRQSAASDLAARFATAAVPGPEAPLRAETVAAHAAAAPASAPVIHVTIDHLEVRAPAASRPPQPTRIQPRAPSVSLADYLRGADVPDRARGRA